MPRLAGSDTRSKVLKRSRTACQSGGEPPRAAAPGSTSIRPAVRCGRPEALQLLGAPRGATEGGAGRVPGQPNRSLTGVSRVPFQTAVQRSSGTGPGAAGTNRQLLPVPESNRRRGPVRSGPVLSWPGHTQQNLRVSESEPPGLTESYSELSPNRSVWSNLRSVSQLQPGDAAVRARAQHSSSRRSEKNLVGFWILGNPMSSEEEEPGSGPSGSEPGSGF